MTFDRNLRREIIKHPRSGNARARRSGPMSKSFVLIFHL